MNMKKIPKSVLILIGIMAVGIFLRTYHFHDWLRFNADQSRDAEVVSGFIQGTVGYPLLGPKAGGTEFRLGGAFYSLQILSAQIFGNAPDKMAYPDLFASILTIPLLFLLMRRAFREPVALVLTAALSVSVFAIKYARFAWNPNSGPFYSILFLYALLVLADTQTVRKWRWAVVAGVALGIGVQLHTLLLIIMPVAVLGFFIFVGRKHPSLWRQAAIVFLIALVLNTGQIVDMTQTNGANIRAFLGGTTTKTAKGRSLFRDVANDVACQSRGDVFIILGIGDDDQCGTGMMLDAYGKTKGLSGKGPLVAGWFFSLVFSVGGVWLWVRAIRKTGDPKKRLLLQLTGWYASVGFVLLIPLAMEISLRFYLALIFVPFVMLGLWLEAILEWARHHKRYAAVGIGIGIVILSIVWTNGSASRIAFLDHSGKKQVSGSTSTEITLGETEGIASYIVGHAGSDKEVFLRGKQTYLFKYLKSIEYFTEQDGVTLHQFSKKMTVQADQTTFLIANAKNKGKLTKSMAETYDPFDVRLFGRFSIERLISK
ncbi:MAG: glycosyltransferase family 39 protein [Candidatus Moraniibacteriota bacterium]